MVSADPALRFAFTCGSFLSPGLIAPCVAFLFAERTGWALWNRPTIQRALLAGGLALAGLRVFDPWTGWVSDLATEGVRRDFGIHVILYSPGWGYTAILAMCAAAATFCVVATVRAWPESSPLQRRQLLPMVLACVPPLVTEVLFNLNPSLTYNIDPTPGVLGVTVSLMGWAVLCSGFVAVAPVGHYAIQPTFSDGHDSGIYTWSYLYRLGAEQERLWAQYLDRLAEAGLDRDAPMPAARARAYAAALLPLERPDRARGSRCRFPPTVRT